MSQTGYNIGRCHACPRVERQGVRMVCAAGVDRPNIVERAGAGYCPLGRFPATIPDDYEPTPQNAIEGDCGCA